MGESNKGQMDTPRVVQWVNISHLEEKELAENGYQTQINELIT